MGAKIQAFDIFQTPLSSHYPLPLRSIAELRAFYGNPITYIRAFYISEWTYTRMPPFLIAENK
jgi:hypothetical protein